MLVKTFRFVSLLCAALALGLTLTHDLEIPGKQLLSGADWLIVQQTFYGGFAIVGPYAAEVWPAGLRTSGMGSAYGFGGVGKIIGPLGLALIVGSSNVVKPEASVNMLIPAFIYLASWFAMAGIVYFFLGIETKGRSIEEIDGELAIPATQAPRAAPTR